MQINVSSAEDRSIGITTDAIAPATTDARNQHLAKAMGWRLTLGFLLLSATTSSHGFFFFIPGQVTGAVVDAITGDKGDKCVSAETAVGDIFNDPNGAGKVVASLSGTSSRCTNPSTPIRAEVKDTNLTVACVSEKKIIGENVLNHRGKASAVTRLIGSHRFCKNPSFPILAELDSDVVAPTISRASVPLPREWKQLTLTEAMKTDGTITLASNANGTARMQLKTIERKKITDVASFIALNKSAMALRFENPIQTETTSFDLNGVPAAQFSISGKSNKGGNQTILVTYLEGSSELISLYLWTDTNEYDNLKDEFLAIARSVSGINATELVSRKGATRSAEESHKQTEVTSSEIKHIEDTAPAELATSQSRSNDSQKIDPIKSSITPGTSEYSKRLRELNQLYNEGLINKDEFENKKKEILKAL